MLILSGHQPVYLPSIHLFSKIALSDAFLFVGHCQYVRKSWHTRNQIRLADKALMLSVPVRKSNNLGQSINATQFSDNFWKRKHLSSIKQAYGKRPYFETYFPAVEALINQPWETLGPMSMALIKYFMDCLGINIPVYDSEDLGVEGHKTDMLISMCEHMQADQYLSNEGSRNYVQEELMAKKGIAHCWQGFKHPVYNQGRDTFIENMSVIDLLFNVGGEEAGRMVQESGWIEPGAFNIQAVKLIDKKGGPSA
ncbi:MAG: WbqC family protein [Magnetovibrio sp.]|nr:WbqC family protein [Magnetovibrio sp.]